MSDANRAGDLPDKLKAFGEDAQGTVTEMARPLKDKVKGIVEEQKSAGADHIADLSGAVERVADEVGKEIPQAAHYIHSAADGLKSASSALRDRSVEDLLGTFGNFARNQPAAAFAGSMVAGFALSRFLKSASSGR